MMLNRYELEGIAAEVCGGGEVVVLGANMTELRCAFRDLQVAIPDEHLRQVCRANGRERITTLSGGRVEFVHESAVRAVHVATPTTVVVDGDLRRRLVQGASLYDVRELMARSVSVVIT